MAVYAAYRHIELDNVGYGKKRVLKPPGGGTSDIFGAPDPVQNSPRRVRNNMQSSVFGPPPTNDGNPVTGEGYTNGEKQPAANNAPPAAAAAPTTNGTSHSAPPQRNRVPPGGYSSGLW
ncbi:hypothetical protein R5R35_000227 [Gryllus longicercus]|uniref:Microtubule-associated protein Jupiter n=1 Tax=Gryllus longicercus TaxID=2509291 RepID=A0AAN9W2M4_9ORTH